MKNNKKHIVFLTPGFPKSEKDTITIPALFVYINAFKEAFSKTYDITIISFQYPFSKKKYQWNEIDIIPLNGGNKKSKKISTWFLAYNTLMSLHKKEPIECIHSFWLGECSFIGQIFTSKNKIPHILTLMGQEGRKKTIFKNFINNSKTTIISLSENQSKIIQKKLNYTSQVIPWFINTNEFPNIEPKSIDILGVGSLNYVKNYDAFISIIFQLKNLYPKINAEILGEGDLHRELQYKIDRLGLRENIKLLGLMPRKKVLEKMSCSNILLHTSIYESFGYVFLEALFSGMRIVSNDVGISRESEEWKVCTDETEMIQACSYYMKLPKIKQRITLYNKEDCLVPYQKLYSNVIKNIQ